MNDQALGDITPDAPTPAHEQAGGVFAVPGAHDPSAHMPDAVRSWTIDEILDTARLPEAYASICLRADLDAEYERLVDELQTLISTTGEVIDDPDGALGEESNSARAQRLSDEIRVVVEQRRAAMWFPQYRGLPPEDLDVFNKKYRPRNSDDDHTDYQARLIAECTVDDDITYDAVLQLRRKLGNRAYLELVRKALDVNNRGGVDAGKLPTFLVAPKAQ